MVPPLRLMSIQRRDGSDDLLVRYEVAVQDYGHQILCG
jgi:hypothetical protein